MRHLPVLRLALPILLLALAQGTAQAQSTPGNAGATTTASAPVALKGGTALPGKGRTGATRDFLADTLPQLAAMTTVNRASDGTITSTPASPALMAALKGFVPMSPAGGAPAAPAPAAAVEKVADANVYPYRAAGEVEVHYGDNYYYCTAVLIGPKTVATSAGCLWGLEGTPAWADDVIFYPAVNDGNAPFGTYDWSDGQIMQGFIDASSSATSDGVLPYAIGLVHLKDAAGDKLGWFGFQTDMDDSYTAHAITYGGGDAEHQMATTTCPVNASTMYRSFAFPNPCAASGGSPFYIDDPAGPGKILHGMNVMSFEDGSSGETRISPVVYQWISDHRQ